MSSGKITPSDLQIAIESNFPGIVKSYLSSGGDPNAKIHHFDSLRIESLILSPSSRGYDDHFIHPICVSLVSCLRTTAIGNGYKVAFSILELLIEAGATLNSTPCLEVREHGATSPSASLRNVTPLSLALFLTKRLNLSMTDHIAQERMTYLMEKLAPATESMLKTIPTTTVLQSVVNTYKKILLSSDQSDIKFVCEDGVILPAHKAVLAGASPYFATAFGGPWAENNMEGEWHTAHPSFLIKAVLTFVYTGDTKGSRIEDHPMDMLSIASEYDITSLKDLASFHCIRSIDLENFKTMAELAHLHGIKYLKNACGVFLKNYSGTVLKNPEIMSLPTDKPDLWAELTAGIAPEAK